MKVVVRVPQCAVHPHVSLIEMEFETARCLIFKRIFYFFLIQWQGEQALFLSVHVGITYNLS